MADCTDGILAFAKRKDLSASDLLQMMNKEAEKHRRSGESIHQSFSKCFTGANTRVKNGSSFFSALKHLELIEKAVGAGGNPMRYTGPSFDFSIPHTDDGGDDPDYSPSREWNKAVSEIQRQHKLSRSDAITRAMKTPGARDHWDNMRDAERKANGIRR
jgi:hypothetical protein